ncbi:hypothetical protein NQ317_012095, partial [Molorchus minor]
LFFFLVLRKAFEAFDSQKSGSIPTDMVSDILRLMGQPFDKKILEELIEEVDADKSGRLEFEEFVTLAAKFIVEEDDEAMQKELKEAFRLYDKEGNGYIPTTCLREILRELDDQLTDKELDMMIEEIDTDGSGTVDFDGRKIELSRPNPKFAAETEQTSDKAKKGHLAEVHTFFKQLFKKVK